MKKNTLAECLHKYDMESLHAYCDEYSVAFDENEKDAVCTALAQELIKEDVLMRRLGILDDETLNGLHDLLAGKQVDSEDVLDHLDGLDLIYGRASDHQWNVPEEVKELVKEETEEWQKMRRSRVWLMQCLTIVQHDWADVPLEVMRELYQKNDAVEKDADLKQLFQEIPVSEITCVMIGDAFVIRGWRTSEVFAGYRAKQKKYSYAMPTVEEVKDLYHNDYDTLNAQGRAVKEWFLKNGAEEGDLELLLHELWNDMNYGHAETEILKEAESMIVYDDKKEQEQFRSMMHQWYIHVRRMDLRGHTLAESNKKQS
jgi:hypothetical protein